MLAIWSVLSPMHLLLIGGVAILLFGNRLPEVARSLGRSLNEFKRGLKDVKDDFDAAANDDPPRDRLDQPPHDKDSDRLGESTNDAADADSDAEAKEPTESRDSRSD